MNENKMCMQTNSDTSELLTETSVTLDEELTRSSVKMEACKIYPCTHPLQVCETCILDVLTFASVKDLDLQTTCTLSKRLRKKKKTHQRKVNIKAKATDILKTSEIKLPRNKLVQGASECVCVE